MAIDKAGHEADRMPKNPSLEERIAWHREHAKHCACRPVPEKLAAEMRRLNLEKPRG